MFAPAYPVRVDGALDRIGRRQERAIWTGMKRYLEAQPQPGRDE
jgi:hypothetical protein